MFFCEKVDLTLFPFNPFIPNVSPISGFLLFPEGDQNGKLEDENVSRNGFTHSKHRIYAKYFGRCHWCPCEAIELICFGLAFHNMHLSVNGKKADTEGVLWKKLFLKIPQCLLKNICVRVFFNKVAGLQVFSCEYFKIFIKTFGNGYF